MFLVVDGIIRHIIHEWHRHQQEGFLLKNRNDEWIDAEQKRKHANSYHNEIIRIGFFFFWLLTYLLLKLFF